MSQVYLAEDLKLGRKVAIKQVSMTDSDFRTALLREALLLSKVRHPNVAGIHDFFEEGKNCCLVMEYIEGTTLRQFGGLPQTWPSALLWLRQLAEALTYLHSQSPPIICRDLNPNNVILSPDRKRVTLIDFGISKTLVPGTTTATIVAGFGTAGYAPIEQYALKGGATNEGSDLYALGCTTYFLLTGDDPPEAVHRSATDQVLDLGKATKLPNGLDKWLRRMTAIKPVDRFSTISEAMGELEKALAVSAPRTTEQSNVLQTNASSTTASQGKQISKKPLVPGAANSQPGNPDPNLATTSERLTLSNIAYLPFVLTVNVFCLFWLMVRFNPVALWFWLFTPASPDVPSLASPEDVCIFFVFLASLAVGRFLFPRTSNPR